MGHTERRVVAAGALAWIGSVGDPIDNAVAESTIGFPKRNSFDGAAPGTIDDVDLATLEYVDWLTTDASTANSASSHRPRPKRCTTVTSWSRRDPQLHNEASIKTKPTHRHVAPTLDGDVCPPEPVLDKVVQTLRVWRDSCDDDARWG